MSATAQLTTYQQSKPKIEYDVMEEIYATLRIAEWRKDNILGKYHCGVGGGGL